MAPFIQIIRANDTLRSATRFVLVGILGTLVDFLLFGILQIVFHIPALPANTISYSAGIVNNFFFHRRWTYALHQHKSLLKQFSRFFSVSLTALLFNNLIVLLLSPVLHQVLGDATATLFVSKLCAVGCSLCWNFAANHLWTFRPASH